MKLTDHDKNILIITLLMAFVIMCYVDIQNTDALNKLTESSIKLVKAIYLSYDCSYLIEQRKNATNTQTWNNLLDDVMKQKECTK